CWLYDNSGQADFLPGDVVILDRLQLPTSYLFPSQDLAGGCGDSVEVRRTHVALEHTDVRVVRRIQGKLLQELLEQAGVHRLRVVNHSGVRLQRDVNGR